MTILPTSKKRILELLAAVLVLGLSASATCAEKRSVRKLPWKSPEYTLVARQMPIRSALESFSVAQGIPILLSDRVAGVLSGDFKGVVIFTSHDHEFIQTIANRIIRLEENGVTDYRGTYDEFIESRRARGEHL